MNVTKVLALVASGAMAASVASASADYVHTLAEAKELSAESGLPILLDIGTSW